MATTDVSFVRRLLVCGSRHYKNYDIILKAISRFPNLEVVIHGAARGADSLAGTAAQELGKKVERFPADWEKHGKAAGHIRNQQMLDEGDPDFVLGFTDNILQSRGTSDMMRKAIANDIPHYLLNGTNWITQNEITSLIGADPKPATFGFGQIRRDPET